MPTINSKNLSAFKRMPKIEKKAFKVPDYASKAWRDYSYQLRSKTLRCAISGRNYPVNHLVVDHIIPVNEGGSFWDERNHQVICIWQHNKKSGIEKMTGCKTAYILNEDGEKIPKQ